MANALQEHFAEILLDKIGQDNYPSPTQMDMLESVASPELRVRFALDLIQRIQDEPHPSIPMMWRVRRLIDEFGS